MTNSRSPLYSILIKLILLFSLIGACSTDKKVLTVGILNIVPVLDETLIGFKDGMSELGYTEDKNIRYIYDGPTTDLDQLPKAAQSLVNAKVDLILSLTTPATLTAKQVTSSNNLPVVFVPVTDPVGAGIVESIQKPGKNITGVAFGIQEERRFEWLIRIAPNIKNIYLPYNPDDQSPVLALETVRSTAEKLGVNLIPRELNNSETLRNDILNIPQDADAVYILPDSLLTLYMVDLVKEANKRNLPTSGPNIETVKDYNVLTSYSTGLYLTGKQAARLADQIFKGVKPEDLPVEMSEFYLAINLVTAREIGLTITEDILRHTDIIVR